ncbi:MAG: hypothetical protein J6Y03_04225 [Alphaproteobacteria bacterium]|nr:hypothetical protein [Alphaproteobacteria bacterium]
MEKTDKKELMEEFERRWKEMVGTPTPERRGLRTSDVMEANAESEILGCWDSYLGAEFDAHGIAKGSLLDQKKALFALLDNGISEGTYTAPFCFTPEDAAWMGAGLGAAGGAYKDGLAVIVSDYEGSLDDGIKLVLLTDLAEKLIPPLQKMYPDVMFSKLSDAQQAFETLYEKSTGKKYEPKESSGTMKDTLKNLKVNETENQIDRNYLIEALEAQKNR